MPDFFRWLLHGAKSGKPRPPDEFIWSPAKHFLFRKCQRAWFFRHYLAQGGWNTLSAYPSMHAYLLKYLDSADSWMSSTAEDSLSGMEQLNRLVGNEQIKNKIKTSKNKLIKPAR